MPVPPELSVTLPYHHPPEPDHRPPNHQPDNPTLPGPFLGDFAPLPDGGGSRRYPDGHEDWRVPVPPAEQLPEPNRTAGGVYRHQPGNDDPSGRPAYYAAPEAVPNPREVAVRLCAAVERFPKAVVPDTVTVARQTLRGVQGLQTSLPAGFTQPEHLTTASEMLNTLIGGTMQQLAHLIMYSADLVQQYLDTIGVGTPPDFAVPQFIIPSNAEPLPYPDAAARLKLVKGRLGQAFRILEEDLSVAVQAGNGSTDERLARSRSAFVEGLETIDSAGKSVDGILQALAAHEQAIEAFRRLHG